MKQIKFLLFFSKKKKKKNLPCSAGDVGSIPGQGTKIPRATGQLGLCHNH